MKVIYFGIYNPDFSRNKVYRNALKAKGVEVIDCVDHSKGFRKYINLYKKLKAFKNEYDAVIVGYPGYTCVALAQLISNKPVIFDALCTYYEGQVLSHNAYRHNPLGKLWALFIDWLAVKTADVVLVETDAQNVFFQQRFSMSETRIKTVYTSVDETEFFNDPTIEKAKDFTVLFRGRLMPEAGLSHVLDAAKLLQSEGIKFKIIGFGWGPSAEYVRNRLKTGELPQVTLIDTLLPFPKLREEMLECHVSLGQFEKHERLTRTIPHKAFESLLMGLPYITAQSAPVLEIMKDGVSCRMVPPGDSQSLAEAIKDLKEHPEVLLKMKEEGYKVYKSMFASDVIGDRIISILNSTI